jgi:hypothetical protein
MNMDDETRVTYLETEDGTSLGSDVILLPIPLYKGMKFTIHREGIETYYVLDWYYHHGHPDENAGLHIVLSKKRVTSSN